MLARGISDIRGYSAFYDELRAHGYDEALLDRLFYTNLMELLDAVERGGR